MNKARVAGVFYLLNIVTGAAALFVRGTPGVAVLLVAAACYVAVTVLFYGLFKPVNRNLSMLAAIVSLTGCLISVLSPFGLAPARVSPLLFFGFYCVMIGYLVFRSTFLPRVLGVLMAIGGIGWLAFGIAYLLSLPLGSNLPAFVAPGLLGEGALTVWLLLFGVDMPKWESMQTADARLHA